MSRSFHFYFHLQPFLEEKTRSVMCFFKNRFVINR